MPAGDQTGPREEGPRTGRGLGAGAEESELEQTAREEAARREEAERQTQAAREEAQRQTAQTAAQPQKSYFDRLGTSFKSSIDDLVKGVKNLPNTIKNIGYTALYAGTLASTYALTGFNPIAIGGITALSVGFMGGYALKQKLRAKKPISYRQLIKEGIKGAILGIGANYFLHDFVLNLPSNLYKAAAVLGFQPIFVGAHSLVDRVIDGEKLPSTKDYLKKVGKTTAIVYPALLANILLTPVYLGAAAVVPIAALIGMLYSGFMGPLTKAYNSVKEKAKNAYNSVKEKVKNAGATGQEADQPSPA